MTDIFFVIILQLTRKRAIIFGKIAKYGYFAILPKVSAQRHGCGCIVYIYSTEERMHRIVPANTSSHPHKMAGREREN